MNGEPPPEKVLAELLPSAPEPGELPELVAPEPGLVDEDEVLLSEPVPVPPMVVDPPPAPDIPVLPVPAAPED